MRDFIKENLDKFLLIGIFLLVFFCYLKNPDQETIKQMAWMAFGGVLTILGVKRLNNQYLKTDSIESADIAINKETEQRE